MYKVSLFFKQSPKNTNHETVNPIDNTIDEVMFCGRTQRLSNKSKILSLEVVDPIEVKPVSSFQIFVRKIKGRIDKLGVIINSFS